MFSLGKERERSPNAIDEAAAQSDQNIQLMRKNGLSPMPVFHQGESFKWLVKMVEDGQDYIGLSTRKDMWLSDQKRWLDQCFTALSKKDGRPLVKTHGFGITSHSLLLRYPWHTVDSTTWVLESGYGKIFVPQNVNGVADYTKPPITVVLSGDRQRNESQGDKQARKYSCYKDSVRLEWVEHYLKESVGVSISQARVDLRARHKALLAYYGNLSKVMSYGHFKFRQSSSFVKHIPDLSHRPAVKPFVFRLFHVTNSSRHFSSTLNEYDIRERLLSFFDLQGRPYEVFDDYLKTGISGEYKPRIPKQNWNNAAYKNFRRLKLYDRQKGLKDGEESEDEKTEII